MGGGGYKSIWWISVMGKVLDGAGGEDEEEEEEEEEEKV